MKKLNLLQFISIQRQITTVIKHNFRLKNSLQTILYMIDVWINKGSGWSVESIGSLIWTYLLN